MIYKMYAAEDFNAEVFVLAEKLSKMPTKALGLTKRLLNQSLTNDLTAQLELESKLQIEAAQSDDYAEGVSAFMEKRKPVFKGK
jgi:2-(1,2-epoxy-1,2-dihydrophenyl)acetyl-CoA isomerase